MKLTLPLPPNRANAREHHMVTHRKKKAYYEKAELVIWRYLHNEAGSGWPFWKARKRLDATLYVWAKMDRDNLMARLKWPIDSLVRVGLLENDNEKWLDLQMPTQVIDRKNMRVEIELVPCKDQTALAR